jgi:hypoxanthine phosphoribosyltransferase
MRTLFSAEEIDARVRRLASEISQQYRQQPLTVIGVLHGSVVFLADLIRKIETPHQIAFVSASSYRGAVTSPSSLTVSLAGLPDLTDRHLLLIDDIFDTGQTLTKLTAQLTAAQPLSLKTAVLVWKQGRSQVSMVPDFYGFSIPDLFVVGYGLDYDGNYRHLPELAVLEESDLTAYQSIPTGS